MSRHHCKLNSARWQRVRRKVLDRDGWRCRMCCDYGNEVDHVQPLQWGGDPWALDNLQVLCRGCHIEKTRRENRRPLSSAERKWREFVSDLILQDLATKRHRKPLPTVTEAM